MEFSRFYPLREFQERDFGKIRLLIETFPLATLISQGEDFPTVTQVPLVLDEPAGLLLGHFDRNNPHCAHILAGGPIYCLFNGPNSYMSPTIYPDEQYPGWNYVAVHVKGTVRAVDDEERLADILLRTAEGNEPAGSSYSLTPAQKNFDRFIKMILGFEILIDDIKGVFKLAQDKGSPHKELAQRHLNAQWTQDRGALLSQLLRERKG